MKFLRPLLITIACARIINAEDLPDWLFRFTGLWIVNISGRPGSVTEQEIQNFQDAMVSTFTCTEGGTFYNLVNVTVLHDPESLIGGGDLAQPFSLPVMFEGLTNSEEMKNAQTFFGDRRRGLAGPKASSGHFIRRHLEDSPCYFPQKEDFIMQLSATLGLNELNSNIDGVLDIIETEERECPSEKESFSSGLILKVRGDASQTGNADSLQTLVDSLISTFNNLNSFGGNKCDSNFRMLESGSASLDSLSVEPFTDESGTRSDSFTIFVQLVGSCRGCKSTKGLLLDQHHELRQLKTRNVPHRLLGFEDNCYCLVDAREGRPTITEFLEAWTMQKDIWGDQLSFLDGVDFIEDSKIFDCEPALNEFSSVVSIEFSGDTAALNEIEMSGVEEDFRWAFNEEVKRVCDPLLRRVIEVKATIMPSVSPNQSMMPSKSLEPSKQPSVSAAPSVPMTSPYPSMSPSITSAPSHSVSPSMSSITSSTPSSSLAPSTSPSTSTSPSAAQTTSLFPSEFPSESPSDFPSEFPSTSSAPSAFPSLFPSDEPSTSASPSELPSNDPSVSPTSFPSEFPSLLPSTQPSQSPSASPSDFPSVNPSSNQPSQSPSTPPSESPSVTPSTQSSSSPTSGVRRLLQRAETNHPSELPSKMQESFSLVFEVTVACSGKNCEQGASLFDHAVTRRNLRDAESLALSNNLGARFLENISGKCACDENTEDRGVYQEEFFQTFASIIETREYASVFGVETVEELDELPFTSSVAPSLSHKPSSSASPSKMPSTSSVAPSLSHKPSSSASPSKMLSTPAALVNLGGDPPGRPLGVCTGDCDFDDECAPGLVCFQRNANETVPGCIGGENDTSRTDYCVYESATAQVPSLSPSPSISPSISLKRSVPTAPVWETENPTETSVRQAPVWETPAPTVEAAPSLSITEGPTFAPTYQGYDDLVWAVCGDINDPVCAVRENTTEVIVSIDELYDVRCCSDIDLPGWTQVEGCEVWATSQVGVDAKCLFASTFTQADIACQENQARLCTREEVHNGCTIKTGCALDSELIWTGTPATGPLRTGYWVATGTGAQAQLEVNETAEYRFRCCSDEAIPGWFDMQAKCGLYVTSQTPRCQSGTWEFANVTCAGLGGRLCTKAEMMDACTELTGCNFDNFLLWTDTVGFMPEVQESGAPSSSGAPSTSMSPSSTPPSASMAPSSTLGPAPVWETSAPTVEAPVWETQAPIAEAPVWETLAPVVEAPVWETEAPGWDDCPEAECIVWDVSIDDSKSTYRLPGHADTYFLVEPFSVIDNSCEDSGFSDLRRIQFNATVTARVELDCYVGGSIAVLEGCEQNIVTVNVTQEACITNDENDDVIANGTRQVFEFLATENVAYFLNFSNVTVDSSSLECPVAECLHFYSALDGWNTFLQPGTNDSYITVEPGLPIDFDCPDSGSSNNDTLGRLQFFTSTFATIELDCCTEGTITVTEGCEQAEVDVNVMEEVCTVTNENGAAIASGTRQVFEFAAKGDVPYFVDFSSVTTDSCTTCPAAECIDYANAVDGWNGFLIPGTFDAFFHVVPDLPFDFGCPDSGSSDTLGRLEFFLSEIVTIELDCCTEGNIIVTEGCEQADVRVEATEHNCVATDDLNNLIGDEPKRKFEFFARENVPYFVDFGSVDTAICNSEPA